MAPRYFYLTLFNIKPAYPKKTKIQKYANEHDMLLVCFFDDFVDPLFKNRIPLLCVQEGKMDFAAVSANDILFSRTIGSDITFMT